MSLHNTLDVDRSADAPCWAGSVFNLGRIPVAIPRADLACGGVPILHPADRLVRPGGTQRSVQRPVSGLRDRRGEGRALDEVRSRRPATQPPVGGAAGRLGRGLDPAEGDGGGVFAGSHGSDLHSQEGADDFASAAKLDDLAWCQVGRASAEQAHSLSLARGSVSNAGVGDPLPSLVQELRLEAGAAGHGAIFGLLLDERKPLVSDDPGGHGLTGFGDFGHWVFLGWYGSTVFLAKGLSTHYFHRGNRRPNAKDQGADK